MLTVAADLNVLMQEVDVFVGEADGNLNLFDNISAPTVTIASVDAVLFEGDRRHGLRPLGTASRHPSARRRSVALGVCGRVGRGALDGNDFGTRFDT